MGDLTFAGLSRQQVADLVAAGGATAGEGAPPGGSTGLYFSETEGEVDGIWLDGEHKVDLSGTPAPGSVATAQFAPANIDGKPAVPSARTLNTGIAGITDGSEARDQETPSRSALAKLSPGKVLTADVAAIKELTTLQKLESLALPIGSSATEAWEVVWHLVVSAANTTMDLKLGVFAPAEVLGYSSQTGWVGVGTASEPAALTALNAFQSLGTRAGTFGVRISAVIRGMGHAGNVGPHYAQNTSDPGNLQILASSSMSARLLSA